MTFSFCTWQLYTTFHSQYVCVVYDDTVCMCNYKWTHSDVKNMSKKCTDAPTYNRGPLSDENSQWKTKIWRQDDSVLGWNSDDDMKCKKMSSFVKILTEFFIKKQTLLQGKKNKLHNQQICIVWQWNFNMKHSAALTISLSLPSPLWILTKTDRTNDGQNSICHQQWW